MDEWIFASLKACNKSWTAHASDSESTSDSAVEKEGAIEEMKEEMALQKTQIASQQEELMHQKDQMARQNNEIALLRESMQNMQDSFAAVSAAAATVAVSPESIPQSSSKSLTSNVAGLEGTSSDTDAGEDESVNEVEDLDKVEKDETALQDKGSYHHRSLEYHVMQNEFEESRRNKILKTSLNECERWSKRRSFQAVQIY